MVFEIVLQSSHTTQLNIHVSSNEPFVIPIPKALLDNSKSDGAEETMLTLQLTIADATNGQYVYSGDVIPGNMLSINHSIAVTSPLHHIICRVDALSANNAIHRLGSIRHEPFLALGESTNTATAVPWSEYPIVASVISVGVLISLIMIATYVFGARKLPQKPQTNRRRTKKDDCTQTKARSSSGVIYSPISTLSNHSWEHSNNQCESEIYDEDFVTQ